MPSSFSAFILYEHMQTLWPNEYLYLWMVIFNWRKFFSSYAVNKDKECVIVIVVIICLNFHSLWWNNFHRKFISISYTCAFDGLSYLIGILRSRKCEVGRYRYLICISNFWKLTFGYSYIVTNIKNIQTCWIWKRS